MLFVMAGLDLAGCGAGRVIPLATGAGGTTTGSTPTPSGTYNLVVSGATAGIAHSVNMSLTVQ